jgi:hypothetical protein
VADTSIDLSRQGEGSERFQPNFLSRAIVKGSSNLVQGLNFILPAGVKTKISNSFETPAIEISQEKAKELPAFDLIRASINLAGCRNTNLYRYQHETPSFYHLRNIYGCYGYFACGPSVG